MEAPVELPERASAAGSSVPATTAACVRFMRERLAVASILLTAFALVFAGPVGADRQGGPPGIDQHGGHDPTPADLLCVTCHSAHNGRADCTSCHGVMHVPVSADVGCVSCHAVHNGRADCTSCHGVMHVSTGNDPVCVTCHDLHSARSDCTSCHPTLHAEGVVGAECLTCHLVRHANGVACSTCHESPHGYVGRLTSSGLDATGGTEPTITLPSTTTTWEPAAKVDSGETAAAEPDESAAAVDLEHSWFSRWLPAWIVGLAGLGLLAVIRRDSIVKFISSIRRSGPVE